MQMQDCYRVVTGPPLSPPGVSVESLEGLATALNALEHPAATLDDFTVGMVEIAFNSLLPRDRQKLLGSLGIRMAAPRRAGSALCRDVLARLRRESRQHTCTCGIRELTVSVMNQVGRFVLAQDGEAVPDPVSRWGATLVRATVFAWCNASVTDAYIVAWAADQDWFTRTADEEETARLAAVGDAARSIVEANPGFVGDASKNVSEALEPMGADDGRGEGTAVTGRRIPNGPTVETSPPDVVMPEDVPATAPVGTRSGEETDPEAACRQLETALAQARQAAEIVTGAVTDGRPPQDDDLAPLTALGAVFDRAEAVFHAAGIEGVPRRLEDLTGAASAHRMARERDIQERRVLRELLNVTCHPDSPATFAAEAVRDAVRRLLDIPAWEEKERQESAALAALARLITLERKADSATEILALQEQVVRVLPACAMAAIMAPELTVGVLEDAVGDPVGAETDGADDATAGSAESAAGATAGEHGAGQPTERTDGTPTAGAAGPLSEETAPRTALGPEPAVTVRNTVSGPPATDGTEAATPADSDWVPHMGPDADFEDTSYSASASTLTPAAPSEESVPAPGTAAALARAASVTEAANDPANGAESEGGDRDGSEDDSRVEAAAERVLAQLVVERRFGLAHRLAEAVGHPEPQVAALRLAGAAALLSTSDSQGARLTADLLQQYGGYAGREMEGSELLLFPALLRTALITGDHLAGAQLKTLVPRLPETLGEAATAVADRALSGALMIASPLVVIADASETEARLRELREQCRALLTPPRLRFARASEIAKRWLAPEDSMLGSLLVTVVRDHRDALPQVREQVERLSKLNEVNTEIDRMDRRHRPSSGKPLQGSGRQDLVHVVERAVGLAKEWCLAVEGTRPGARSDGERAVKEISSLRQFLLDGKEAVLGELEQVARHSTAVAAATAWAARASMEELFALLAGDTVPPRPGGSAAPELVLDVELLKVCDTLDEQPLLDRLFTAVDRSWQDALAERLTHDAFAAARTIVELAGRGALPGAQAGRFILPGVAEITEREAVRRTEMRKAHDELVAELHRAQADGAVTDDQDLSLQELLADARDRLDGTDTHDLLNVRRALDTVGGDLPAFRRQAADRIRARLDALDPTTEERAQVLRHLDTGGLATAADLVYFLEIGEPVPEIETGESHLTEFFPTVPDGLPKGIDRSLVELVRSGGKHPTLPVLDYGALSTDEAALAADALDEWRELGATEPRDRLDVSAKRQLFPALKLLGYDAEKARPMDERSPHRREYRLFEVTQVEINGRAKAPAFGSQIREQGGNLRVLMVWGRPPAKVVMSLAERDTSGASLLIVYFGTLSREARVELAVGSARLQPMLVVDDAALAYLAAHGNRQASTATQTLLPFSGVNPYIREKRGRIGGEMFYGRDAERKSILDPRGTQVIFGGRGLGKSALLSDAGERFVEQRPGFHQAVYVNLDQENIGKGSSLGPEALWSILDRELTDSQVLGRPQRRRSRQDISEQVRAGIRTWLDGDSRRSLLILLDECDQFFEADAPASTRPRNLRASGPTPRTAPRWSSPGCTPCSGSPSSRVTGRSVTSRRPRR
ncbi:hypothetical protein [Streptomyces katsurahamanus]|uniref:hypothetical protein n=1 Tax=Streptomyces katsurahamanus TaxID=2577098 RepID=UPI001E635208|nr:hypothetical protein [Streptomyces katsurahamanus]